MPPRLNPSQDFNITRLNLWYRLLLIILVIFGIRLFYLQIIKHDFYRQAALSSQLKEYEIPASRGIIEAHDRGEVIPIVLNEKRYTLFADPKFIQNKIETAQKVIQITGGNEASYIEKMSVDSRYSVLAKKLTLSQKHKIDNLKLKGIGTRETEYRTYPQGNLAAQLLGFVNDDGEGKYGLEQYLDKELRGTPGQLRAITDASGIPLVSNPDNIIVQPTPGKRVRLTIDVSMQRRVEELLKDGLTKARADSGSVVVLESKTGAVKAMANYPSYKPAEFFKVKDASLFINNAVASPLEIGSSMKPLTVAAGLDKDVISLNTTFYDRGFVIVGDKKITNVGNSGGAGTKSVADILQQSLNTGAVFVLKQLGGGDINEQARVSWHEYLTGHYGFGQPTGIEQGYEAEGSVPDPKTGYGLGIQYANTAFGQGISVTPLQMAAAFNSVINNGTYVKPYLVDQTIDEKGRVETKTAQVIRQNVVKAKTSKEIRNLLVYTFSKNRFIYGMPNERPEFKIGGKTGTAEIAKPGGGYYEDRFNGTYAGFVGGDEPQYVIFLCVKEPRVPGFAGAQAAAPLFIAIVNTLIDDFGVKPKGV